MSNAQTLLLLPGDGIGPEVTEEARRVAAHVAPDLQVSEAFFGGGRCLHLGKPDLGRLRIDLPGGKKRSLIETVLGWFETKTFVSV